MTTKPAKPRTAYAALLTPELLARLAADFPRSSTSDLEVRFLHPDFRVGNPDRVGKDARLLRPDSFAGVDPACPEVPCRRERAERFEGPLAPPPQHPTRMLTLPALRRIADGSESSSRRASL